MNIKDYRYVFIVTYGRSGSTLLMSILNSIEGYNIKGENFNTLFGLFRATQCARRAKREFGGELYRPSWAGVREIDPIAFSRACAEAFVSHVLQPRNGDRVLGFKEIRYVLNLNAIDNYLTFIEEVFPDVLFVFNIRDPESASKSGWWKKTEGAADTISRYNDVLGNQARLRAKRSHLVHYDQYCRDLRTLKPLFDFLGEDFDYAVVREVLAAKVYS